MKDYSTIYYKFPQGELLNEFNFFETEKRFFYVSENLEITTVFPLVLYLECLLPKIFIKDTIIFLLLKLKGILLYHQLLATTSKCILLLNLTKRSNYNCPVNLCFIFWIQESFHFATSKQIFWMISILYYILWRLHLTICLDDFY